MELLAELVVAQRALLLGEEEGWGEVGSWLAMSTGAKLWVGWIRYQQSLKGAPELHISLIVSQLRVRLGPGTMRLCVCILLLSFTVCANALLWEGGKFVLDAMGGKLLSSRAFLLGAPSLSSYQQSVEANLGAGRSTVHTGDPAGFCCWKRSLISPFPAKANVEECLIVLLFLGPFSFWWHFTISGISL